MPRLVVSSKDDGSNISGPGSILNNFITEGVEEDDCQVGSQTKELKAATVALFNTDGKSASSNRNENDQIYIDASN